MGKLLVRLTVVFVALYFLLCYMLAQFCGIDALYYSYTLLFELITVVYCFSEGKYHCRFLKSTMLSIFLCDLLTRLDYTFDFLTTAEHNLIPISILALGIGTSITLAIRHFMRVIKLRNERERLISNQKSGNSIA